MSDLSPYANSDVLQFYKVLPFNKVGDLESHIDIIRALRLADHYPPLAELLAPDITVLDVGCGVGWLACAMALEYRAKVTGLDFNPTAIDRARQIVQRLGCAVELVQADLFLHQPESRFDVVVSLGALHHTNDCPRAVRRCFAFAKADGHVVLGLYHAFGRKPFLEHFALMRKNGASEDELRTEYGRLHALTDRTHLTSWFRDQVLHPHETQHTLREVVALAAECGFTLRSTSINRFQRFASLEELYAMEPRMEAAGRRYLEEGTYYPGFFVAVFGAAE